MVLALDTHWIWDAWYANDGTRWHAYFLKAPKSIGDPELRHFNVAQGHAISDDLRAWTHLGTCLEPAPSPAWDDYTTWTGSVVRGGDGLWHLFYTGTCRAEAGRVQRVGHATSKNMHDWVRVGAGPCLDLTGKAAAAYEAELAQGFWHERAMRDPWVMRDPEGDGWLMYFTARGAGIAEPNAGGAIGLATSPDLYAWTLQPPVFVGGYGQLEVPQVFGSGGRWYCLFCTAAQHFSKERAEGTPGGPTTGSHYLTGTSARGPWRIAEGAFLDGALPCRRYAARILDTDEGMVLMGFAYHAEGRFVGQVMDPERVEIDGEGRLRIRALPQAAE